MTLTQPPAISAAVRSWRDGLANLPDPKAFLDGVEQGQRDAGLTYKGATVLSVAEPVFVTPSQLAGDQQAAMAVLEALAAAGERIFHEPSLRPRFFPDWRPESAEADLVDLPSGYPAPIVFGRLDGMRVGEELHFLEFNGGIAGGITPADLSAAVMASWPVADAFAANTPFRTMTSAPVVMATLVDTWHAFGGSGLPYTVFGMPHELREIAASSIVYLQRTAVAAGLELDVAEPGDLTYSDGRLRCGGRAVDVLIRGFFTTMVDYLGSRLDGVLAALRAGDLCMITSMRSGFYGYKTLFAALTDEAFELDLPAEVLGAARRHLPWTRIVDSGVISTPEGDRSDLVAFALARRAELVLKPGAGFGGSGVELGWQHSDASWSAALTAALRAGGYVLQRAIASPQRPFATLAPGFPVVDFTSDHNPIICGSSIPGYYVRVTPGSGVTNVTTGAGIAPCFLIDD
jgi:hypothetical protein